ncbi:facilitated trehalose transporter Tret1-like [Schistocerca cancellata]|uniref:facilitated trehalose transporter Tret1-like n=1 Tax=Schistocerca cancellata TaxID=274614 RepID=UPI0021174F0E|nr:facilitated trehalose transporter Tret1-like [Schistocerca cancellata]
MNNTEIERGEESVSGGADENINLTSHSRTHLLNPSRINRLPQFVAAFVATIGAFAMGTVMAWTAPASGELQSKFNFNISEISWIGSFVALGAAAVVLPVGYLTDKLGRKLTMLILVTPFLGGWAVILWAKTWEALCAGRFIVGMAGGAFTVTVPIYIGEIADNEIRATLGSFFQLMVVVGVLFVYIVGRECNLFWMSAICGLVPIVFGAAFVFMPETPAYYLGKGKEDAARKSLLWLRGTECDLEQDIAQMKQAEENSSRPRPPDSRSATKMSLFIALGLMTFQQLSGINAIIFYTTDIFHAAGSTIEPSICTIVVGTMQVGATLCSSLVINRLGCRVLLLTSGFVMATCTYTLGVFFHLQARYGVDYVRNFDWLPLASLCLYIIVFSIGFGPVPWMMMGVLFPPHIKGLASSITCLVNWMLVFVITKFFANLLVFAGTASTFWLFSLITAIGTVFVFFVVPETNGKSLEEIQMELSGSES